VEFEAARLLAVATDPTLRCWNCTAPGRKCPAGGRCVWAATGPALMPNRRLGLAAPGPWSSRRSPV